MFSLLQKSRNIVSWVFIGLDSNFIDELFKLGGIDPFHEPLVGVGSEDEKQSTCLFFLGKPRTRVSHEIIKPFHFLVEKGNVEELGIH